MKGRINIRLCLLIVFVVVFILDLTVFDKAICNYTVKKFSDFCMWVGHKIGDAMEQAMNLN